MPAAENRVITRPYADEITKADGQHHSTSDNQHDVDNYTVHRNFASSKLLLRAGVRLGVTSDETSLRRPAYLVPRRIAGRVGVARRRVSLNIYADGTNGRTDGRTPDLRMTLTAKDAAKGMTY